MLASEALFLLKLFLSYFPEALAESSDKVISSCGYHHRCENYDAEDIKRGPVYHISDIIRHIEQPALEASGKLRREAVILRYLVAYS